MDLTWVGVFLDVDAFDEDGAGGRAFESFDHFEGGRLAGLPLGAEHAEGFAGVDGEGECHRRR